MANRIPRTPAFVGFFVFQMINEEERITEDLLEKLTIAIYEAAGLQPLGEMVTRKLDSPIEGYPAYCTVQPLMTSVISLDAWPEHSRIVCILHSCKFFTTKSITYAVRGNFPKLKLKKKRFVNFSYPN